MSPPVTLPEGLTPGSAPLVRVGIPTFRRAHLLRRALASLQAQTFGRWVATVFNDDPDDPRPAALVGEWGDPRVTCVTSSARQGAVAVFNRAFTEGNEPFFALLEDDNLWDPPFLERLFGCLAAHPTAAAVWCNQRILEETSTGDWIDRGHHVRPPSRENEVQPVRIPWENPLHATGTTISNGALLVRRTLAPPLVTPADIPFSGAEALRQRLLPHPLLYLPATLATLARTQVTARAREGHAWGVLQTLLIATYVRHAQLPPDGLDALWQHWRREHPSPLHLALHAALSCPGCRPLLGQARLRDWLYFIRTVVGRPGGAWACLRARHRHPAWWSFLDRVTADRFEAARAVSVQ